MGNVWVLIPEDEAVPALLAAAEELLATLAHANDPETNPDADTDGGG
ncbi:hypothetical protein [Actinokineospora sp. UTMC 2448]|nr:hypothetical protein [Actinokineospora sp. UTMC 2448]